MIREQVGCRRRQDVDGALQASAITCPDPLIIPVFEMRPYALTAGLSSVRMTM
jgi:hypothetical protein